MSVMVTFAGVMVAAVFCASTFATMEKDRKERETDLIARAQRCNEYGRDHWAKRCAPGFFGKSKECITQKFKCILGRTIDAWKYEVACGWKVGPVTGTSFNMDTLNCLAENDGLLAYEDRLVTQASASPMVETVCGKQSKEVDCRELLQKLKEPAVTNPVSLSLPLALQKLASYLLEQLTGFFEKNCKAMLAKVMKDKALLVTCAQSLSTPPYATVEVTCEGNKKKKKLTAEAIANAYEPDDTKPIHAKKSHAALVALLCENEVKQYSVITIDQLKMQVEKAAMTFDWMELFKKME